MSDHIAAFTETENSYPGYISANMANERVAISVRSRGRESNPGVTATVTMTPEQAIEFAQGIFDHFGAQPKKPKK